MTVILDSTHGALFDLQRGEIALRFVLLRPDDGFAPCFEESGTAASFADLIDGLPETGPRWIVCNFPWIDRRGGRRLDPLILSWAPPAIRGAVGAHLVLGARDLAWDFSRPPVQILLSRRMSAEDIAHYLNAVTVTT